MSYCYGSTGFNSNGNGSHFIELTETVGDTVYNVYSYKTWVYLKTLKLVDVTRENSIAEFPSFCEHGLHYTEFGPFFVLVDRPKNAIYAIVAVKKPDSSVIVEALYYEDEDMDSGRYSYRVDSIEYMLSSGFLTKVSMIFGIGINQLETIKTNFEQCRY